MSIRSWMRNRARKAAEERRKEMMYDESNLADYEKFKRKAKDFWCTVKYPTLGIAAVMGLYGAGLWSQARVNTLGFEDLNGDNNLDALVAFPLRGTGRALVGYIDSADFNKLATIRLTPSPMATSASIDVSLLGNFNSLGKTIESHYSNFQGYTVADIRKKDYADPESTEELVITVTPGPRFSDSYFPPRELVKIPLEKTR